MKHFHKYSLAFIFIIVWPLSCLAQVNPDEAALEAKEISGNVMSPFCPGRLLSDCPSGQAAELRQKIEKRIEAGEKKEAVLESIYKLYGDELRAAPKTSGFGLVAWLAPFIFLLLGLVGIALWLRRKISAVPIQTGPALDAKTQARVDSELNNS
jgi:cytochrome c-type biogenesis protein CcmH